jgi:hypothetical protein
VIGIEMVFVLLLVMMVGGYILLYPIARRLGAVLEQSLTNQKGTGTGSADVAELRSAVRELQVELSRLEERQVFTESLLVERNSKLVQPPSQARTAPAATGDL